MRVPLKRSRLGDLVEKEKEKEAPKEKEVAILTLPTSKVLRYLA